MLEISRSGLATAAAVLTLASVGCGKNGNDKGTADPTATDPGPGATKTSDDPKSKPAPAVEEAPKRGPEHAVYSLWDNRLAMHHQRGGGLFVPVGSSGLVKYMRFGRQSLSWKLSKKVDGVVAGTTRGKVVGLHVPLTTAVGTAPKLRIRVHSAGAQPLGFRINGKKKKEVTTQLEAGWSTIEVAAPDGAFEAGENELLFFARKSAISVEWLQVGGDAAPVETAWRNDDGFILPDGGGFDAYVMVPKGGLLVGDVGGEGCAVKVEATSHAGKAMSGELKGVGRAVELGALSGQIVRLSLRAASCAKATLTNSALVVPGAAPTLEKAPAPKHVVLWIMDSLRADKIPTFVEGARAETPVMDELAKTGAVFTHTYVHGNETKASHASIWTSLYPLRHKMIPPNSKISHDWVTVDEVAKSAGMFTSGVSANGYITPKRGFGTKWDKYRNHIHEGGGVRAEQLLKKAKESLAGKEKEPWMLYIGTIDTHVSWRAKEPWFSKYDPKPYSGRFKKQASGADIGAVAGGKLKVNARDIERIRALYDSNVSYQDQQVGELLKWLEENGIADDTMLIITADHGDELFEDKRVGHGAGDRDSLFHVPLLIHYPKMFGAGKIGEGAEAVDIVPTIADALGVEANKHWQGVSLRPLSNGVGAGYPRMSLATKYENSHVGRIGPWKLRVAGANAILYNLVEDPAEKKNFAKTRPIERRFLSDAMWQIRAFNDTWRKSVWGNPANVTPAFAKAQGE